MADYKVRGENEQDRNIYSDIKPLVATDQNNEIEEYYHEPSSPLNKEQPPGEVPKTRNRIIFGPWTMVYTVVNCTMIACIIVYSLCVPKYRHQDQRWKGHSSTNHPPRKCGLDFPQEYPKLDIDHSTQDCRDAWHSLTAIPCQKQIWIRNWDYGLSGCDLIRFLPLICREDCTDALNEARNVVSNSCSAHDKFNIQDYEGRFNTTLLEPNPAAVMDVLVARQTHDCRKSPIGDAERDIA